MNSPALTKKQQQAAWLRYGRRASINQIALWLKISRRAVLARLRNARRRTEDAGAALPIKRAPASGRLISRMYSASQISGGSDGSAMKMEDL
jgi:DNA-binding CsgD family transcriptional regulator